MALAAWFWIAVSVALETGADVCVKLASQRDSRGLWLLGFAGYVGMLLAWFAAVERTGAITVPGIVWLLCGQIALVSVGTSLGERLSSLQLMGAALAAVALLLLSLPEAQT